MEEGKICKVGGLVAVRPLFGKAQRCGAGRCPPAAVVPPRKHKHARVLL